MKFLGYRYIGLYDILWIMKRFKEQQPGYVNIETLNVVIIMNANL